MFNFVFIPFVLQTISCVIFFSYYIYKPPEECGELTYRLIQGTLYTTTIYFEYLEILQIFSNKTYFFELINYIDNGSTVLNLFLIIQHDFFFREGYEHKDKQHWAAFAILLVWFKVFYWMRLFTETAFFINLLKQTLKGIRAFSLMTVILVLCIANIMYVLNLKNEDNPLFELHLPYDFANAVIFAYDLALGEYDTGNFPGEHQEILWVIFGVATFML